MSETIATTSMGTGAPSLGGAPSMGSSMESSPMGSLSSPSLESGFKSESMNSSSGRMEMGTAMAGQEAVNTVMDTVKRVGWDNALEVLAGDPQQYASTENKPTPLRVVQESTQNQPTEHDTGQEANEIARLKKQLEEMKRRQKMLEMQLAATLKKLKMANSVSQGKGEEVHTLTSIAQGQEQLLHQHEKVLIDFTQQAGVLPNAA